MEKNIAVIWGDCSSPEIVKQTIRVLDKVAEKYGHTFHYTDAAMGGEAIDKYGDPLPQHASCWVPWAAPSGRACPVSSARRRACCACVQAWACTPTTARPRSGPSWLLPAP